MGRWENKSGLLVAGHIDYYNQFRLYSALWYRTPQDKLEGKEKEILAEWDRKLEAVSVKLIDVTPISVELRQRPKRQNG